MKNKHYAQRTYKVTYKDKKGKFGVVRTSYVEAITGIHAAAVLSRSMGKVEIIGVELVSGRQL